MDERPAAQQGPQYRAFVSYSHADMRFASWLHRRLEAWRLPDKRRLAPIFIDRAELPAGPDLSVQVRAALERSDALVVIASPAAQGSRWVAQEIALFRELHPERPILAALIEGEPAEAFPAPLTEHRGKSIEPLAADFRKQGDGKRLALIKIVAGLSGLPLDRLVQRDAQIRQRRVTVITAAALALSVVLASLLAITVKARAEAERQRTEAEGMVEFMLTDLRDRLKGVGRLDIMDAVNERAMAHYAKERDFSSLPPDMLARRARLLHAMAEDDLKTSDHAERGRAEAAEAWRVTSDLLRRDPNDPERIFDHAQSEYYIGYVAFQRHDKPIAVLHWQNYLTLAESLVVKQPDNRQWQREVSYANGNMCAVHLADPPDEKAALPFCTAARIAAEDFVEENSGDTDQVLALANQIAWEADAQSGLGHHDEALALRQRQDRLTMDLVASRPGDARALEALMRSDIGLARAQLAVGQKVAADATIRRGLALAERLHRLDPENHYWRDWQGMLRKLATKSTGH